MDVYFSQKSLPIKIMLTIILNENGKGNVPVERVKNRTMKYRQFLDPHTHDLQFANEYSLSHK